MTSVGKRMADCKSDLGTIRGTGEKLRLGPRGAWQAQPRYPGDRRAGQGRGRATGPKSPQTPIATSHARKPEMSLPSSLGRQAIHSQDIKD